MYFFQGVRFDPDLPQTLRLEFAKSNTKVTKPKQQSPQLAATHPTIIHPLTGRKYTLALATGALTHLHTYLYLWDHKDCHRYICGYSKAG